GGYGKARSREPGSEDGHWSPPRHRLSRSGGPAMPARGVTEPREGDARRVARSSTGFVMDRRSNRARRDPSGSAVRGLTGGRPSRLMDRMLHLAEATRPEWVARALANLDEILVDHAHCEKKAASTAVSLLFKYPERPALLAPLARLAREELGHFEE